MNDFVRGGFLRPIDVKTDTGHRRYGIGRQFRPAATNLIPDREGALADGTFWPADTAHTDTTANLAPPIPLPSELQEQGVTKCLKFVNDGTADAPETATVAVTASKDYFTSLYVYAPTLGGNLTITAENGHTFSVAALTGANAGWVRYSVKSATVALETTLKLKFAFAGGTPSTVYVTAAQLVQEPVLSEFFNAATRAKTDLRLSRVAGDMNVGTLGFRYTPETATHPAANIVLVRNAAMDTWYSVAMTFSVGNTLILYVRDTAATGSNTASTAGLTPGVPVPVIGAWDATTIDLKLNGVDTAQKAHARTIATGTEIAIGDDGFSSASVPSYANLDMLFFCGGRRMSDADRARMSAAQAAGDDRAAVRCLSVGDWYMPLKGDSRCYEVVRPFDASGSGDVMLAFDGNSIMLGTGSTAGNTMPEQMLALLGRGMTWYNGAVGGQRTTQMTADVATEFGPRYVATRRANILHVMEGGNDIIATPSTAQQAHDNLAAYVTAAKALGFTVVIHTILPRTTVGFNTVRNDCNTLIRADLCGADAICDAGGDAVIGPDAAASDVSLYGDGTHMTNAGYARWATLTAASTASLL